MTDYARERVASGYSLASTDHGDSAHIFGRGDGPLCGRAYTADRDPVGALCGNCKQLARAIGLLADESGGERA